MQLLRLVLEIGETALGVDVYGVLGDFANVESLLDQLRRLRDMSAGASFWACGAWSVSRQRHCTHPYGALGETLPAHVGRTDVCGERSGCGDQRRRLAVVVVEVCGGRWDDGSGSGSGVESGGEREREA